MEIKRGGGNAREAASHGEPQNGTRLRRVHKPVLMAGVCAKVSSDKNTIECNNKRYHVTTLSILVPKKGKICFYYVDLNSHIYDVVHCNDIKESQLLTAI
ncbi:hypothetical protein [Burkholderia sp. Ac-20365]|uniref:hypothetical protein n=1 Tax=Burkholderia sp. Ac-20365 TaxID=2703897 RepID=UPI00197B4B1B|nr:hypothetical protein [Burkholderia sp. Ac-20365]MBN3767840.1 hypothetical protein [Burkholderia sp. Ac-20365]